MKKRSVCFCMFSVVIVLMFSFSVSAVGIGFADNVEVLPGQSVEKALTLQNVLPGEGDLIFTWEIIDGSDYISFPEGNDFRVNEGETKRVKLNIDSGNAEVGETILVSVLFDTEPVSVSGSDTIQVTPGVGFDFNIVVVDELSVSGASDFTGESEESNSSYLIWVLISLIVLILIVIIIWLVLRKRNQQSVVSSS